LGLSERLRKLERVAGQEYDTLTLPSGEEIRYPTEEAFEALAALLSGEDHPLHPHLFQAIPDTDYVRIMQVLEGGADGT
jgi:hypothetical protein